MLFSIGGTLLVQGSARIDENHFGSVVKIGETDNAALMEQGTRFDASMDYLNIGSIRYPGGTEGVVDFDISDAVDLEGLRNAIDYCAEEGYSLNFTLSDLKYFYKTSGGIVISQANQAELRNFIANDLVGYARSKEVVIESVRIGNEFIGKLINSDGPYLGESASGYGKNAAALANLLDSIFDDMGLTHESVWRPDIVVESAGWVSGAKAVIRELVRYGAADKIDAIDLHGAHNGDDGIPSLNLTWDQYFGTPLSDEPGDTYTERIQSIIDVWKGNPSVAHVDLRMDAWAYPTDSLAGTGLINAGLGILQMHTFSSLGMISATNYIAFGADNSALVVKVRSPTADFVVEDRTTAAGQVFRLMANAINGKTAVSLASTPQSLDESNDEFVFRAFEGEGEIIIYVISRKSTSQTLTLSMHDLLAQSDLAISGMSVADISVIGLDNPNQFNDRRAFTDISTSGPTGLLAGPAEIQLNLDSYEIAQITLTALGQVATEQNDMASLQSSGTLHGLSGNDLLFGSVGDDTLSGGVGNDTIQSGSGNDLLFGGVGADVIDGGAGFDTVSYVYASTGLRLSLSDARQNFGSAGGDSLVNIEHIVGSNFQDTLIGSSGNNSVDGGAGSDIILGGSGADTLLGGLGNDTVSAGSFADLVYGGAGFDLLIGMIGHDQIFGGDAGDSIYGDGGDDTLLGDAGFDLLSGGTGSDLLYGGIGEDTLNGGLGSDQLFGGEGHDYIFGGSGSDTLVGGFGLDHLIGGNGEDVFIFREIADMGDVIYDFGPDDSIGITGLLATALGLPSALSAENFKSVSMSFSTIDYNDYLIYRRSDKTLWSDYDGNGPNFPTLITSFIGDVDITHHSFILG